MHYSGYVNIIGRPNVGKSTLMNALLGEQMSIITKKPQTTRHRILGILNEEEYQIVFSDTPGIVYHPAYQMQFALNRSIKTAFEDADVLIVLTDPTDPLEMPDAFLRQMKRCRASRMLVLNKGDLFREVSINKIKTWWAEQMDFDSIHVISALKGEGVEGMMEEIKNRLPEFPPYFPKDQLTDRPERFFVSEIVREKILELYHQEIPYSAEVVVTEFKESENIIHIYASIFVNRQSQKAIIIGKGGKMIKDLGIHSRKSLEAWLKKKVYLELYVRVKENWRDDERLLNQFGYR